MKSSNAVESNVEKIAALFPQCITETAEKITGPDGKVKYKSRYAIDFDKLRAELSEDVLDEGEERYQFTWPDKRAASRLANEATDKTLRPDLDASEDFWNTKNLYIEGDNLDVLKVLRENYLGAIKMIYIDPPYNTGNDFVYNDEYSMYENKYKNKDIDWDGVYEEKEQSIGIGVKSGLFDEEGNHLLDPMQRNTESNGRFHTDWLNMIYPRLKVARDLLAEDGVILISIDDNEVNNLLRLSYEIFGENNIAGMLIHQRAKGGGQAKHLVKGHDYIIVGAKDISKLSLSREKVIQKGVIEINGESYIVNDDIIRKQFGKYDKSLGDRRCFYEEIVKYKGESKKREIDEKIRKGEYFLKENPDGTHTICRYEKISEARSKLYTIIKVLSEEGKIELDKLGLGIFPYPKPVELLRQLVDAGSRKESTILDFFSGSATTAHAVMKLNAEDGGKRKFIMVQLPEVTDEKSEARKAGYKTICEIGEERIRRAGRKIKEEAGLQGQDLDTGFRVLKLDSSNMEDVFYTPEDFDAKDIFTTVDNVKPDRTPLDLLFQVLPELNIELSAKIETKEVNGKKVFFVDGNYLIATFDTEVNESTVTELAKMKPQYFVMRDASAANDNVLDNFEQIFRHYSPDTIRKIL